LKWQQRRGRGTGIAVSHQARVGEFRMIQPVGN